MNKSDIKKKYKELIRKGKKKDAVKLLAKLRDSKKKESKKRKGGKKK